MPTTRYRTHNGRIRGQAAGGTRTTYLTDTLGSVTATVDASAAVVNRYAYKPSGLPLSKGGSGADPRYRHAGDSGSRTTGLAYAEQFNRRRHLGTSQGAWTSVDPLWPNEWAYAYAWGNPATYVDPSGLCLKPPDAPHPSRPWSGCNPGVCTRLGSDGNSCALYYCFDAGGTPTPGALCNWAASSYYNACQKPGYPIRPGLPPGNWRPIPTPGAGGVFPPLLPPISLGPPPPQGPCLMPGPPIQDPGPSTFDCLNAGIPTSPSDPPFSLSRCDACCNKMRVGAGVDKCYNSCYWAGINGIYNGVGGFGGPSGTGEVGIRGRI